MAFDFKKEYREFYMPKNKPGIVTVPSMNYIAVRGRGDPNREGGEYKQAIAMLYGIAYTVKMSRKGDHRIDGYYDFVIPPLEGFWWQNGVMGIDYARKDDFNWISVIRLPDCVTADDFALDMLVLKFIQGLPVVGVVGGLSNPVYYNKIMEYIRLKYHKRYLLSKKEDME